MQLDDLDTLYSGQFGQPDTYNSDIWFFLYNSDMEKKQKQFGNIRKPVVNGQGTAI